MDAFTISDRLLDELLELSPIFSTYAGVPGRDHLWDDLSPEGVHRRGAVLTRYAGLFASLPADGERRGKVAARVASGYIDEQLEQIEHGDYLRDLNTIASPFQAIKQVFDVMDTGTDHGWDAIITRLETIDGPLGGLRETLDEGRRRGLVAARRQVEAVAGQARTQAGTSSSFQMLRRRLAETPFDSHERGTRMDAAVAYASEAFEAFARFLEETYLPDAAEQDAVGEERYLRSVRTFLGDTIDPIETYRWGWTQVLTLREQMVEVARRIDRERDLREVIDLLESDPARCVDGPEAFLEFVRGRLDQASRNLNGTIFDIPPEIEHVDVNLAPPGGALGAYYVQPSEDFSRPGSVWWAFADTRTIPVWDEVSTAYHEGFPGHHLQVGVQMAVADLSRLHKLAIWYPGYGEGWALYTELLMHELGYLEKPEYELGMLAAEMLRACRVAIDIGSHLGLVIPDDVPFHPGEAWSFETAVDLLVEYAFLGREYAESEVNRYLGWPGQAISYKVGERTILDLRETVRSRLGAMFTLKDFHHRILDSGPVGLALLRELVLEQSASGTLGGGGSDVSPRDD